jgi:hypothetical protein
VTGGEGFAGAVAGFAGGDTPFGFRPVSSVFGPPAAPAPDAGPTGASAGLVADFFSGVGFTLGLVTLGTGPGVVGVLGFPAAPVPGAGSAGDVIDGLVADLFSGASLVPGVFARGAGAVVPGTTPLLASLPLPV